MTSASGVATAEAPSQRPVNLLMSGPVAGVVGGIWAGRQAGYDNVITLDVGGTSADIGLAAGRPAADEAPARHEGRPLPGDDPDGRRRHDRRRRRLDRLRRRRAASSASARAPPAPIPGPAAYGRGGTEPTATDAMVNLGWLLPGGVPRRRHGARRRARARGVRATGPAQALGMSVEEASMGAVQILTHSMVQSIEENSVRKGYDPRDFALVAEGGAGPLFACADRARGRARRACSSRRTPGSRRRWACSRPTWSTSTSRPTYQRLSTARRGRARSAASRSSRQQARRAARGGRRPGRPHGRSSGSPTAATSARGTSFASTSSPGRSTTPGSRSCAPASTTSTSASTRGASRSRTSRSPTSASAASG